MKEREIQILGAKLGLLKKLDSTVASGLGLVAILMVLVLLDAVFQHAMCTHPRGHTLALFLIHTE